MKLLFCTETGCSPYHWPLFLGYTWLVTFFSGGLPHRPPSEGRGRDTRFETLYWWRGYEQEHQKKGRGGEGLLLLWSGNQVHSQIQSGKCCLQVLQGSAVVGSCRFLMFSFTFFFCMSKIWSLPTACHDFIHTSRRNKVQDLADSYRWIVERTDRHWGLSTEQQQRNTADEGLPSN